MVAKINSSRDAGRLLRYQERKLETHAAELIHARNFFADPAELSYEEKLRRFEFLNEQRPDVERNMLHIAVSFRPGEELANDRLAAITDEYMKGIGFAHQPYLVYRHHDTESPHLHLLTNIIEPGGHRINTHNIGREKSEPTRLAIERDFGLLPAQQSSHRGAINKVIEQSWNDYRFTTLEEYNALLRYHHLRADPMDARTPGNDHHGLLYRRLDYHGRPIGLPIKASSLAFHPTMARLEEKFAHDLSSRAVDLDRLETKLDWALHHTRTPAGLADELHKEGIEVHRAHGQGQVVYLDHENGVAISGGQLPSRTHQSIQMKSLSPEPTRHRNRDQGLEPDID